MHILRSRTSDIDPRLSPRQRAEKDFAMGIMLIDACKPYGWKDQYPPANRFDDAYKAETLLRWRTRPPF